jgi:3-hydroxyisobutyrate dehydrogenase-like beta-hydroxyacid dehydrogenase
MTKVAFIGLGRMGHGMAGRYLDTGFSVAVWNRSKAKAEDLIARGARWAASPSDAADGADAVVTMVADDAASRAVWLGNDGAAAKMKSGALAIECSTVSYQHALDLSRELRGRGFVYVDCPVTGLPDAAAAGKLTLLVGAAPADLEKARPYLAPLSTTIRHFGAVGSGTVFKLINNLMGAVQIASLALQHRLPSMSGAGANAEAGGLIAYGPSYADTWRRSATYVHRILQGAKPGDLAVEQPTTFEFVVNVKTAKALGLTIPPSLLQRADQIIQ